MALNISIISVPWTVFIIVLVLVVGAIIALTVVEVKLRKRANSKKQAEETYYQRKLSATKALEGDPNSFLISLDKTAREFFSEMLELGKMGRYSELIENFRKKGMTREAEFSGRMQEALYSGEEISKERMHLLFGQMASFILSKEKEVTEKGKQQKAVQQPRPNQGDNRIKEEELNSRILQYYREGKNRGFETSLLTEKLLSAGFEEEAVKNVLAYFEQEMRKPRIAPQTEKRILTRFHNQKREHRDLVKQGMKEKDEIHNAEIIEIVPYKEEVAPKKKVNYPQEEPEEYKRIGSLDNLDRLKDKIASRKKGVVAG